MESELRQVEKELEGINLNFSTGTIVNRSSMELALSAVYKSKDWQEQLAFVVRALLCDHIFLDGNKRTAAAYIMGTLEDLKYRYDPFKIDQLVLKIAKRNIINTKTIRRMIENAATKNF